MRTVTVLYVQITCLVMALVGILGFICPALISADDWTLVVLGFAILIFLPLLAAYAALPAIKRIRQLQKEKGNIP